MVEYYIKERIKNDLEDVGAPDEDWSNYTPENYENKGDIVKRRDDNKEPITDNPLGGFAEPSNDESGSVELRFDIPLVERITQGDLKPPAKNGSGTPNYLMALILFQN